MTDTTRVLLVALLVLFAGCKKQAEPEGYRVVGHDAGTHEWTIIRTGTFDGKYLTKRMTVVCYFYQWGSHEAVTGPEACHLRVGRLMIPNMLSRNTAAFLNIFETDEVLSIEEGYGADRTLQYFNIVRYEVVPDNAKSAILDRAQQLTKAGS
jgi:hypothetical protein